MAKLKKLIKENFSVVGGIVSTPAINAGYGSLSQIVKEKYGETPTQKITSKQVSEALRNYNQIGKSLYQQQTLKETAKRLSSIAEMAASHTLQETEDWFDKVTVSRNMKELTNHSKAFSKIAEEASSVQQRLASLYEDMGMILNRYYDIPESEEKDKEEYGDTIKEGDYEEFFQSAMKKFGVSSPDELGSDEEKKKFFNYVDKNYKAKAEGRIKEGGPGSGRPAKPGSARDIDKKMSAAADDANARLAAAEKAMKAKKKKVKEASYSFSTTDKRDQISPMGYNMLRKDVIMLKDAVKYLERSVKKQHQSDTHHDLIYLLTRAHEAYKNSKK